MIVAAQLDYRTIGIGQPGYLQHSSQLMSHPSSASLFIFLPDKVIRKDTLEYLCVEPRFASQRVWLLAMGVWRE